MVLLEQASGQAAGVVAADQNLHRLLFHFAAHALNFPFGHHIALAQQDHLVGNRIHLVQDMAGHDHVAPILTPFAEERDGFGAGHGVETVERLVEHQYRRIPEQCCCDPETLAHAEREATHAASGNGLHPNDPEHLIDPRRRNAVALRQDQ